MLKLQNMKKLFYSLALILFSMNLNAQNAKIMELEPLFVAGDFFKVREIVEWAHGNEELSAEDRAAAGIYQILVSNELSLSLDKERKNEIIALAAETFGTDSRNHALSLLIDSEYTEESYRRLVKLAEIFEKNCGKASWEYIYSNIFMGFIKNSTKDFVKAQEHVQAALDNMEDTPYKNGWMNSKSLLVRTISKAMQGDVSCFDDLQKAGDIATGLSENGLVVPLIEVYGYNVMLYAQAGAFQEAVTFGEQLLEIMDSAGLKDTVNYIANIHNIATAYFYAGDKEKAKELLQYCKSAYEAMNYTDSHNYKSVVSSLEYINQAL